MMRSAIFSLLFGLQAIAGVCIAAEDLDAPPVVTALSWAIADADSGELLWTHLPDEPRKAASTTKMMAAHVVLELARANPAVLDEVMDISESAAATGGSSAGILLGDRIRVRDGLYGLMLPSGNDMGNALAEHFHARLAEPGKETPEFARTYPERVNFVAEMNRTARRLGMKNTHYRIAYGDGGSPDERTTTARDLVTLAVAARRHALFREIVTTVEKTATIGLADGNSREAYWKNTNKLLDIEGYEGIKTGSTTMAGSCLVASGVREGRRLIVVTLGSASDESRYADSRNLFRWAWGELDRQATR